MDATMTATTPAPKQREGSGYSDLHQSRKLKVRPEESSQSREREDNGSWTASSLSTVTRLLMTCAERTRA
jgi:hypothetical protein